MQQIRQFFSSVSDDCCLACYNQDLVGFFTSIPVSRIMEAVDWMLQQFMLKHNLDPATYSFSVSLSEKDSKLRVWKGKARAAGRRMYQIYFRDILAIVRMSCDSSYFTVLGRVFAQQRGAAIGNQISPVLASISVAFLEQAWVNRHFQFLQLHRPRFLCLRYVDNRIVLIDQELSSYPAFQEFLHDDFYIPPVQLEAVTTPGVQCEFLGFDVQLRPTYALEMIMTSDHWRFRVPSSIQATYASSSLYKSRASSIRKYVWPDERREWQLVTLDRMFRRMQVEY